MSELARQPLVSVVIPTYNRADTIVKAIASVRNQSYTNWEIVVVDDASKDNTRKTIEQLGDFQIRYLRHNTNLGGSEARNTGIDNAKGEYIAFLDSDDIWQPNKLAMQIEAIRSVGETKNIVSYTQFSTSFQTVYRRNILPERGKQNEETLADYLWLHGGEMLTSTLIVSRQLAAKTRFQSRLKKHQDLDFLLRLEKENVEFVFVSQPLTIWHNEFKSDRVSKILNYQISLDWIENYRQQISERAFYGFVVKEIVPKLLLSDDRRKYKTSLIFKAFQTKAISLKSFLLLMLRAIVSRKHQEKLKTLVEKLT